MANVPFSMRLNDELKAKLKCEAELCGSSESSLVVSAIKNYLDMREHKRLAIDEAIKQADQGDFISSDKMRRWIDSWGSNDEQGVTNADIHFKS